ncbi:MAG: hypothetical protein PHP36_05240 [Atribacterota bacterium]|nr:hypothetical protein [Atribacterota bacterium]
MDIKDYTREMADRRFAALETLKTITEWLSATKPTAFLEKGAPVGDDQAREIWRRWVDAYSDLFEKTKVIPDLLIEDVKKLYASEKGTSASQ